MKAPSKKYTAGFTLIEILVATAIAAIVILSINTVLYNAFDLQERSNRSTNQRHAVQYALNVLKQDLQNALPPGEGLVEDFVGENLGSSSMLRDRLTFYTTSGEMNEMEPWGDVIQVQYSLQDLSGFSMDQGLLLVRSTVRNLLSTMEVEPTIEVLLKNVIGLKFYYYSEESWSGNWDSTLAEDELPEAIRAELMVAEEREQNTEAERQGMGQVKTFQVTVPLVVKAFTLVAEEEEGESTQNASPESPGNQTTGQTGGSR